MKAMVDKWLSRIGARAGTINEGEAIDAPARDGGEAGSPGAAAELTPACGADPIVIPVAEFGLGDVVRHRFFPFRGVIFDVDPEFANSEEWWEAIPAEVRPRKDQPFYHLLAENDESAYVAYVSQQNLIPDDSGLPVGHPAIGDMFDETAEGAYVLKRGHAN